MCETRCSGLLRHGVGFARTPSGMIAVGRYRIVGDEKSDNGAAAQPRKRTRLVWSLLSMVGSLLLCLVIAESILRAAGFSYELRASIVGGADAADLRSRYDGCEIDRDLIWVPKNYGQRLDRTLAAGPDVLFMGDSCTELGSYDECFAELTRSAFPDRTIRTAELGVTGWSSYQGLQQMKQDVLRIRPPVVTIYYGWNDHWNSIGFTDAELTELNASPLFRLRSSRLVQLLTKARVGLRRSRQDRLPLRVPLDSFRQNLAEMVNVARSAGIVPVLFTAPTSHEQGREPKCLAGRWVTDLNQLVPLHRQYVQVVRAVAKAEGVILCDLAAEFDKLPREEVRDSLFWKDGIHLTQEGDKRIAQFLFECFKENDLFEETLE